MENNNQQLPESENSNVENTASQNEKNNDKQITVEEYDRMSEEVNNDRTRKPGSQSNSADTHNNGRGGGK